MSSFVVLNDFYILDDEKGAIRLIVTLLESGNHCSRMDLLQILKNIGVGQTAFYSSLKRLKEWGFIEDKSTEIGGRKVTYTALTPKGRLVAEKLREIRDLLREPT